MDDPLVQFTSLYDQFYRNVLRYALQHAERDSAEDVASEVFLIAWRRRDSIPDPPLPWLLVVAWHGLSIADAATVAGCSPRAFTVRLHRARRRLTDALQDAGANNDRSPITSLQGK